MGYINRKYPNKTDIFADKDGNIHHSGDLLDPYRQPFFKKTFSMTNKDFTSNSLYDSITSVIQQARQQVKQAGLDS